MVRLEIVSNISLEDELFNALEEASINFYYTKLSGVKGKGDQGERQADSIWPQENFLLIAYLEEAEADKIIEIVYDVKCNFPKEGINVYKVTSIPMEEPERVKIAQENAKKTLLEEIQQRMGE